MNRSALTAHIATPLLGVSAGLRSFTPLAVLAGFAAAGKLPVQRTWAQWLAHPASVATLTALAAGEYVGDKLPKTPDRTSPIPLLGRLFIGGTAGAVMATVSKRPWWRGALLGAAGAAAGTFGGFYLRRSLTRGAGLPDLPVALSGDVAAAALAVRSVQRLTAL